MRSPDSASSPLGVGQSRGRLWVYPVVFGVASAVAGCMGKTEVTTPSKQDITFPFKSENKTGHVDAETAKLNTIIEEGVQRYKRSIASAKPVEEFPDWTPEKIMDQFRSDFAPIQTTPFGKIDLNSIHFIAPGSIGYRTNGTENDNKARNWETKIRVDEDGRLHYSEPIEIEGGNLKQ